MRIGLDGIPLTELKTGVGTYTLELARALAIAAPSDEFQLIAPKPFTSVAEESEPPNLRQIHSKTNPLTRHWWSIGLPSYIRRNSIALFHGTNFEVPLRRGCPTVLSIQDLSLMRHSNTHVRRAVHRGRVRLPLMVRKATIIVTPSESARQDVCEYLKVDPNRVIAVPLAPSKCFRPLPAPATLEARRRLAIDDEFLLFVGTLEPRKNLLNLIRAFEAVLNSTNLRPQLVIAGKMGWKNDELLSYLANSEVRDRVRVTGYLSVKDLRSLYSSCRAFIYPSIHEGFGLPPLEAMACGAPVIASPVPSVAEPTRGVARLVSPDDVNELAKAMVEVLQNESMKQRLAEAGLNHAAGFSWERTAALTREVYEEAMRIHGTL
jgi:glycosyltransferase involved in cell wall biosynthesis